MGRCCPVGGVCLFYRSCDGVTAVEAASGLKVAWYVAEFQGTRARLTTWQHEHISVCDGDDISTMARRFAVVAYNMRNSWL